MKNIKNINEYIANSPKDIQDKLQALRKIIKKAVPDAEEKISYGMPFFSYKGRLVYFALMKDYIGLYIPPPIIEENKNDLKNYTTTKSAIHFPLKNKLPILLINKLVKARKKWNETLTKKN